MASSSHNSFAEVFPLGADIFGAPLGTCVYCEAELISVFGMECTKCEGITKTVKVAAMKEKQLPVFQYILQTSVIAKEFIQFCRCLQETPQSAGEWRNDIDWAYWKRKATGDVTPRKARGDGSNQL